METFEGWSEQDEESEFKSYYVVWKLKYINKNKYEKESLNRTMQYGNYYVKKMAKNVSVV